MERVPSKVGEDNAHPDGAASVKGGGGFSGGVRQRSRLVSGGRRSASRSYTIKRRE
jgi:hypothetical protein